MGKALTATPKSNASIVKSKLSSSKLLSSSKPKSFSPKPSSTSTGNKKTAPSPTTPANKKFRPSTNKSTAELHQKLRQTAEQNRDARNELVLRMNKIWNDLRSTELEPEKRTVLCTELATSLKGKVYSFAQRPDTSRVLQTLFKLSDAPVRNMILDELKGHVVELCKGKYSSFLILALLRNAKEEKERQKLAVEIRSSVRVLGSHSHGARVVNLCLSALDVLTVQEKKRFYEHFYGNALLMVSTEDHSFALKQYLPADATKRHHAMQPLQKVLLKLCEKGLLRFPFAQVMLWEFLQNCDTREDVLMFLPAITEASLVMVGTWEGARSIARVLTVSDSKERKKIVKEWKGHILDLCTHKFGWYVICYFLRVMDDTKFSAKTVFGELFEEQNDTDQLLGMLAQDEGYGRKVLLFVLAWREEKRMHAYFEEFDMLFSSELTTSKKDDAVRSAELAQELTVHLVKLLSTVQDVDAMQALLQNRRASDVIRELFLCTLQQEEGAATEWLERVAQASVACLDDARAHLTVKRMVRDETVAMAKGHSATASSFAVMLCDVLLPRVKKVLAGKDQLNRVCFVLDALAEHPLTAERMAKVLKPLVAKLPAGKGVEALKLRLKL